jgi:hypothetical protein
MFLSREVVVDGWWMVGAGADVRPADRVREGFEAELGRQGYAPGSVTHHLRLIARLDGWLTARSLDATGLTTKVVDELMAARRAVGAHGHTACVLEPLLVYLRGLGAIPPPAPAVVNLSRPRATAGRLGWSPMPSPLHS